MNFFKWTFCTIVAIIFLLPASVFGLSIEYTTILGTKNNQVLIEQFGIQTKKYFICTDTSGVCKSTAAKNIGAFLTSSPQSVLTKTLSQYADHIIYGPNKTFVAFYTYPTGAYEERTLTLENTTTNVSYSFSESVPYWDLLGDASKLFDFTPDGKTFLYLDARDGFQGIYKADIASLAPNILSGTKLETSAAMIEDFIGTANDIVFYIGNTAANPYVWSLYRYDLNTNQETKIASNVSYEDTMRYDGRYVLFNKMQGYGYNTVSYDTKTGTLHSFKLPNISTANPLANQTIFPIAGSYAVLMTPPKTMASNTLVIWLHGGPYRQTSYGYQPFHSYGIYDTILEQLRAGGAYVLKLDYPGSLGFGDAYANSLPTHVGVADVQSVEQAINTFKATHTVSSVYLMGNSYGGYLSLVTLAEDPSQITGALSINGVTDWQSLLLYIKTSIFNSQFGGLPNGQNQTLYNQASIINKIANIANQPIMIMQGQVDKTIAPWQATLLYNALKSAQKNVTLVQYANEDHVLYYKKNIDNLCVKMLTFANVKNISGCN